MISLIYVSYEEKNEKIIRCGATPRCLSHFGNVFLNLPHVSYQPLLIPENMAITMADSIIRKACDRCHSQKLSCKRVGDEACERCVRLQTECKSSPSLRYKKQHQQHGQQYQRQQQRPQYQNQQKQQAQQSSYPTTGLKPPVGRRSPKRRRTASELGLAPEEQGT